MSYIVDCRRWHRHAKGLNIRLFQVAVNRSRLRGVVDALLRDMPAQHEAAKHREEGIEFARQYHNVSRALSATVSAVSVSLCSLEDLVHLYHAMLGSQSETGSARAHPTHLRYPTACSILNV